MFALSKNWQWSHKNSSHCLKQCHFSWMSTHQSIPPSSNHAGWYLLFMGFLSRRGCLTREGGQRGTNCCEWFIPGWDQAGTQADDGTLRAAASPNIYLTLRWRAWNWCHWWCVCGESFHCLVLCITAGFGECVLYRKVDRSNYREKCDWSPDFQGGIVAKVFTTYFQNSTLFFCCCCCFWTFQHLASLCKMNLK